MNIIFGIISGIVTGLGMGGGTILILLLSSFQGLDQHIAQATNLIFFVPTSISTIFMNLKQRNLDLKIAIKISAFGIIGAIIGAIISKNIESRDLRKYFAIFIFFIAIYEIYTLYKQYKKEKFKT